MMGNAVTFNDILNFKNAIGSRNIHVTLMNQKKPIFIHLWDHLFKNRPDTEVSAAKMIKSRVEIDLKKLHFLELGIDDTERVDQIFDRMNGCIVILSEFIRRFPELETNDSLIRLCLERCGAFAREWNKLNEVVDFLKMSKLEEITFLTFSAEYHLSNEEMLDWLVSEDNKVATLLLYYYFNEDPDYRQLLERQFSSMYPDELLIKIGRAFTRINLLQNNHHDLANRVASGVLDCVYHHLDGGPEAIATFIVERKYTQIFQSQTRHNLYLRLDRQQKLALFQMGRHKQYYERLIRQCIHGNSVAIEDKNGFYVTGCGTPLLGSLYAMVEFIE